jgi:predicted amidohydrolase
MKIAAIEMTTACDPEVNMPIISDAVRAAAKAGAQMVALPETCVFMEKGSKAMRQRLTSEADNPHLGALCQLADELSIWLLIGSMVLADGDSPVNRSLLISPEGQVAARYDKIHMFDVTLENGETHRESAHYKAGEAAVLAPMGAVQLGLSICYDVRFPNLYRRLAQAGAHVISVPSAFTHQTGAAHWHILLRARAIETGCYIIAPAQVGKHENGRHTYGHSLIIDPWGEIIAEAQHGDRFIMAQIDPATCAAVRQQLPALEHGKRLVLPSTDWSHD